MNLKVFSKEKINKSHVLIGKNGTIRFSNFASDLLKLEKKMYWQLAIDEDEEVIKNLYLVKSSNKNSAWETRNFNGRWIIEAKEFISQLAIKTPRKCQIEQVKILNNVGFKLKFVN